MLRRCITALTFVAGTMLIHAGERYLTVLDNAVETLNASAQAAAPTPP